MSNQPLRQTHLSLPDEVKEASVKTLNHLLRKFLTLALLTKQAHWNLRGANFLAVHEMLDGLNAEFLGYADDVAERAVQLGGVAMGTPEIFAAPKCSSYSPYPTDIHRVEEHLGELLNRLAKLSAKLRKLTTEDNALLADDVAVGILQTALASIEKHIWFIEAQLA